MKSKAEADAKRVYERERAAAYRDFYRELETVGKLSVAQAVSHKPFSKVIAEIGKLPSDSLHAPPSPFERALFGLYERIIVAYKRSLMDAQLPTSIVILRLYRHGETTFQEIYLARIEEFAQRAGFYAEKAFPDYEFRLWTENARGHTVRLLRQFEDEILAMEESSSVADETIRSGFGAPHPENATGLDAPPPAVAKQSLSKRDQDILTTVGEANFKTLTNSEIIRDRNIGKQLKEGHKLKAGTDATKACLDRIRRAKGYPLSRDIINKRSAQK
jgi:hypothetical protein